MDTYYYRVNEEFGVKDRELLDSDPLLDRELACQTQHVKSLEGIEIGCRDLLVERRSLNRQYMVPIAI